MGGVGLTAGPIDDAVGSFLGLHHHLADLEPGLFPALSLLQLLHPGLEGTVILLQKPLFHRQLGVCGLQRLDFLLLELQLILQLVAGGNGPVDLLLKLGKIPVPGLLLGHELLVGFPLNVQPGLQILHLGLQLLLFRLLGLQLLSTAGIELLDAL